MPGTEREKLEEMVQGGRVFKKQQAAANTTSRKSVKGPKKQSAQQQRAIQKKLTSAIHKKIEKEVVAKAGGSLRIVK